MGYGFGFNLEVLEPEHLRDTFKQEAALIGQLTGDAFAIKGLEALINKEE